MKKIKMLIFIIFLMCLNIKTSYAAIKVIPSETFIGVDYSQNLNVVNTGSNDISWMSNSPNVVTVNNGTIVGINIGEAYVKVTDGVTVALCKVKVIDNYVPVQSIKLNQSGDTLILGDVIKLNPDVYPINASNKKPSYLSSNTEVASVDANGYVTAKKLGTANISAMIENKVVIYKVNVVDRIVLNGISVNSNIKLKPKATAQLNVTFNPSNATNKNVSFKSSNPNVATVTSSGLVKAIASGTATITVTADDGGHIATSKITVTANNTTQNTTTSNQGNNPTTTSNQGSNPTTTKSTNIKLKGISLSKTSLSLNVNGEETLSVTYNPNNATNKEVTWRSSNTSVVTVTINGKVKAISPGEAVITVISKDGAYEAKCNVVVKEGTIDNDDKSLKEIKLSKNKLDIKKGKEVKLDVIYTPSDASNKDVTWTSSDEKVVTVSNGKIKALTIGEATIKVVSADGNYQDKCDVVVYSDLPVETIAFESDTQTVYIGSTITLKTITTPENTLLENPIWTSSDEYVATVLDGVVTAIDEGITTITVSDENNKVVASTVVQVIEKPLPKLSITIDGYDLKFDPSIKDYTLMIGKESKLNITTNYDSNRVTIAGNRDLKNGSIITVTVLGNENTKNVYIINIKKKGFNIIYFIAIISVLLMINLIRIVISNTKKKKR